MFRLAYCITTHSAQGATYDFEYSIYDWELMNKRLKFVALSRATSESLINIM
jgi:ATP-dependent exoDNAse (exonuclease V) alpha subunit